MYLPQKTKENLLSCYSNSGEERGGYIRKDGELMQIINDAPNPIDEFWISCEDMLKIECDEGIIALFHTHPGGSSNLSKEDYDSFLNWPELYHFIVGENGITCYKVTDKGTVAIEEIETNESKN